MKGIGSSALVDEWWGESPYDPELDKGEHDDGDLFRPSSCSGVFAEGHKAVQTVVNRPRRRGFRL